MECIQEPSDGDRDELGIETNSRGPSHSFDAVRLKAVKAFDLCGSRLATWGSTAIAFSVSHDRMRLIGGEAR